jgi:hypothetical protein
MRGEDLLDHVSAGNGYYLARRGRFGHLVDRPNSEMLDRINYMPMARR